MIACRFRSSTRNLVIRLTSVLGAFWLGAALAPGLATAAGAIDPSFGSSGQIPAGGHLVLDVVPTAADGLLVLSCLAQDWEYSCYGSLRLRRFTRDGSLDAAFGENGVMALGTDGSGAAIVQRSNGALLVAGRADDGNGFIAATTASGQVDPVFGGQSVLRLTQPVRVLAVEGGGKLLVGTVPDLANFADCPAPGWTLQRLSASGAIDPTFGDAGSVTSLMIDGEKERNCDLERIWAEPDGDLVIQTAVGLRRLRSDGSLETTFGTAGGLTATHGTITRTADGGFIGIALTPNGWAVRRFDSNGRDDPTFGSGGRVNLDVPGMLSDFGTINEHWVERFAAVEEGKRYYASAYVAGRLKSTGEFQSGTFIFRFLADGGVDAAFGTGGKIQMSRSAVLGNMALFMQSDGKPIVAGGGAIYRLLTGDEASPGIVSASLTEPVPVVEGSRARIVVSRTAGNGTAVSVSYQTVGQDAVAELDFMPVSGRLSWAAGDSTDRIVEVPIVDDTIGEAAREYFVFRIAPAEGAPIITSAETWIAIADNDPPPAAPVPPPATPVPPATPSPPPQSSSGGGGGAIGVTEAIVLLGIWAAGVRSRRNWTLPAAGGKFRRSNPGFDRGAGGAARIFRDRRPRPALAQDRLHHLRAQLRSRGADRWSSHHEDPR